VALAPAKDPPLFLNIRRNYQLDLLGRTYRRSPGTPFTVTATPSKTVGSGALSGEFVLVARPVPVTVTQQPGEIAASFDAVLRTDETVGTGCAQLADATAAANNNARFTRCSPNSCIPPPKPLRM
jgi:hypothetical protein